MARIFVQDNGDGSYSVVYEDGGNFEELHRGGDLNQAQNIANVYMETRLGISPQSAPTPAPQPTFQPPTPQPTYQPPPAPIATPRPAPSPSPVGGGGGTSVVGGTGQLDNFNQGLYQAYLDQRLRELEKPTLQMQQLQNLANLTGYVDPAAWAQMTGQGAPSATATGGYQTANGNRTVQQMREELVKASGGMDQWRSAPDAQVISEYGKVTGKGVTPISTSGTATGTTGSTMPPGLQQTLDRDRFDEQKRQFEKQFGQQSEQFWANFLGSKSGPQNYIQYQLAQASVPEDQWTGDLMEVFRRTPSSGPMQPSTSWEQVWADRIRNRQSGKPPVSYLGPPEQSGSGQPTVGRAFMGPPVSDGNSGKALIGPPVKDDNGSALNSNWFGKFTQPNQITSIDYRRMSPSQRSMLGAQARAFGVDETDYWDRMKRAFPQGQANRQVSWR